MVILTGATATCAQLHCVTDTARKSATAVQQSSGSAKENGKRKKLMWHCINMK